MPLINWRKVPCGHEGHIDFSMRTLKFHRSAFDRQCQEAISIKVRSSRGDTLLNNKKEYNRSLLPELAVELGGKKPADKDPKVKVKKEAEDKEPDWFGRGRDLEKDDKEQPCSKRVRLDSVGRNKGVENRGKSTRGQI